MPTVSSEFLERRVEVHTGRVQREKGHTRHRASERNGAPVNQRPRAGSSDLSERPPQLLNQEQRRQRQ